MKILFQGFSLLVATACLLRATSADAGLQVTLSANGFTSTITDNGAGDIDGSADSIILTNYEIGGAGTSGVFATLSFDATNSPGGGTAIVSSNNNLSGTLNSGSTVDILVNATGFTSPVTPPSIEAVSQATYKSKPGGNTEVMYTVDTYIDNTDTASTSLATAGTLITTSSNTTSTTVDDTQNAPVASATSTYALNLFIQIDPTDNSSSFNLGAGVSDTTTADGDITLTPTPEPASMALLGLGGLFAGVFVTRRKRKTADELSA